jgi:hypothetical protein
MLCFSVMVLFMDRNWTLIQVMQLLNVGDLQEWCGIDSNLQVSD